MFFKLKDGTVINKHWLNNVFIEETEPAKVVYEMVNGSKRYEQYDTEEEAQHRKQDIVEMLTDTILWD